MQKLTFDSGMQDFRLPGGVLRFNPADPNVYARFLEAAQELKNLENSLAGQLQKEPSGQAVLTAMKDADLRIKAILNRVFGGETDFDRLLCGVNLLAAAENGERVITNLLAALQPILVGGAQRCAKTKADEAVQKAQARRAAQ